MAFAFSPVTGLNDTTQFPDSDPLIRAHMQALLQQIPTYYDAQLADKMPLSKTTVGAIGEFKSILTGVNTPCVLPSGGTWEYILLCADNATGTIYFNATGTGTAGVAAGGTQISAAKASLNYVLICRRIA